MHPELAVLAARQGGVVLRRQALEHGYSADEVEELLRRKEWVRVRRGAYAELAVWQAADLDQRHRLAVHAVDLALERPAVFSHESAARVLGLRTWDLPRDLVHVTRPDLHSARTEGGVCHHAAALAPEDAVEVDGVLVTSPGRTAIDIARTYDLGQALVTADAALAEPGCSPEQLREIAERLGQWRGARGAGRVVRLADARAETPGETLLRLLWHLAGLPELDLQVEVALDGGALARLDALLFAGDLALEFDGRLKYRAGEGRTPQQVSDILWAEKLRHDAIVRLGLRVERFIWAELMAPGRTKARMRSLAREVLGPRLVPLLGE